MSEKLLNLLGLMRKAGAIEIGETNTGAACREGKGKALILALDASDNARRRAESFVNGRRTVLIQVPFTKENLSEKLGVGGCSMAAITDLGFANAFVKGLAEIAPEQYKEVAERLEKRLGKAVRRRKSTAAEKNKHQGKREE